jgi:stage II sporulation protein D
MRITTETWTFPKAIIATLYGLILFSASLSLASDADPVRVRLGSSNESLEILSDSLQFQTGAVDFGVQRQGLDRLRLRVSKNPKTQSLKLEVFKGAKSYKVWSAVNLPLRIETREAKLGPKHIPPHLILDQVGGVIELRAEVEFSEYLMGVLSREMPGSWPMEALKAQAIATRSYTLSQMKARTQWSFDLEGSILDQEFEWVGPEKRKTKSLVRWAEALTATRNQVLRGSRGEVFRAFYHADCGGRTTTPDFVWGPAGDYKSVRDPACETRKSNKWQFVARKKWLRNQLQDPAGVAALDRNVAALNSHADGPTQAGLEFSWIQSLFDQRVTLVEWWDGLSDLKILSGQNFRQLLGFGKLKSLRFQSHEKGQNLVFEGQGFGHGVGLCQWGSKDWAEQGLKAEAILNHYYPLARIGTQNITQDIKTMAGPEVARDLTAR